MSERDTCVYIFMHIAVFGYLNSCRRLLFQVWHLFELSGGGRRRYECFEFNSKAQRHFHVQRGARKMLPTDVSVEEASLPLPAAGCQAGGGGGG